MHRDRNLIVVVLAVVLSVGFFGPNAWAQQGSPSATPAKQSLEAAAAQLIASIKEKRQEIEKLREQTAAAASEDRAALEGRVEEKALEMIGDVQALSDNVLAREEKGLDAEADREQVEAMVQELGPLVRKYLGKLNATLGDLKDELQETALENRPGIEDRIADIEGRIDGTFRAYVALEQTKESLGLDVADDRQYLSKTLSDRAELLSGRITAEKKQVAVLRSRAKAARDNTELATELETKKNDLDQNTASLGSTIQLMDTLGLDSAQYKQLLFEATGEITTDILSGEVLVGLAKRWANDGLEWLKTNGPRLFLKGILFLLILLAFRILARAARRLVKKSIHASTLQVSQLLERTAVSVTGTVVMIFGFLVALSQLGVEVGPMLAGLGVAGFIVGFALQDTLGNFASGVMILLYRPYDVGDLIETAGAFGKVSDMSLVATTILTLDHQTLVVPNSKIWGDVIKNVTAQQVRRVDMIFGISYSGDIPQTERVLQEIVLGHDKVLDDPAPMIKLHSLGESSVDFIVRPWAKTGDYWDVYWDITREVKMRFDAEGISIPFPQRDIHLFAADQTGHRHAVGPDRSRAEDRDQSPGQEIGRADEEDDERPD